MFLLVLVFFYIIFQIFSFSFIFEFQGQNKNLFFIFGKTRISLFFQAWNCKKNSESHSKVFNLSKAISYFLLKYQSFERISTQWSIWVQVLEIDILNMEKNTRSWHKSVDANIFFFFWNIILYCNYAFAILSDIFKKSENIF